VLVYGCRTGLACAHTRGIRGGFSSVKLCVPSLGSPYGASVYGIIMRLDSLFSECIFLDIVPTRSAIASSDDIGAKQHSPPLCKTFPSNLPSSLPPSRAAYHYRNDPTGLSTPPPALSAYLRPNTKKFLLSLIRFASQSAHPNPIPSHLPSIPPGTNTGDHPSPF